MNNFNNIDWKKLKRKYKLTNKVIAENLKLDEDYVKNITAPSKKLPTWAISMLFIDNLKK